MEDRLEGATKICVNGHGHMTKMAAMAINSKTLKNLLRTRRPIILKLGMKHQAMEFNKVYINCDPWMTLTYYTARST